MKKRTRTKALVFGAFSITLYTAVFTYSDTIMTYFTKGGLYAVLPVVTALLFSYIHGSFASNIWTVLGITASIKTEKRPEQAVRIERDASKPQAQASFR